MWKEGKKRRAIIGKMNNNLSMPTKHPGPGCVEKIQRSAVSVAVREGEERC